MAYGMANCISTRHVVVNVLLIKRMGNIHPLTIVSGHMINSLCSLNFAFCLLYFEKVPANYRFLSPVSSLVINLIKSRSACLMRIIVAF
jgi:hypothetical protein